MPVMERSARCSSSSSSVVGVAAVDVVVVVVAGAAAKASPAASSGGGGGAGRLPRQHCFLLPLRVVAAVVAAAPVTLCQIW